MLRDTIALCSRSGTLNRKYDGLRFAPSILLRKLDSGSPLARRPEWRGPC